jgi:S1-C subfamily serine protease
MMHDSDGEDSQRPRGWADSWAQPDEGQAAGTPPTSPDLPVTPAGKVPPGTISSGGQPANGQDVDRQVNPGQSEPGGQVWYASEPTTRPDGPAGQNWYSNQPTAADQGGSGPGGYGGNGSPGQPGGYPEPRGYAGQGQGQAGGGGFGAGEYGDGYLGYASEGPGGGRRHRRRWLIYGAVGVLAAGIGAGVTVALDSHGQAAAPSISSADVPGPHNNAAGSGTASAPLNRAAVEKKVAPGLVDITATLSYASETAEGSGMILSANGLVLTNNHVIDGATQVSVTLADPKSGAQTYAARILGYDVNDDVALLQLVGASGLPTVTTGNSSQVKLGTRVLALGNADGKGGARSTAGVINALDRTIQANDQASDSTENLKHMLQTNAVIQQGDSGGALANNAGQVIGMITAANTSTSSRTGHTGASLGFAIPINSALTIAQQIAAGTTSANVYIGTPGFLGVQLASSGSSNPTQQRADQMARGAAESTGTACENSGQTTTVPGRIAPTGAGALVLGVLCQTAASQLGLVPGDVITSVDGQPVTTPTSLTQATARDRATDVVTITWTGPDGTQHSKSVEMGYGPAR